jgi:hypothetical protein
MHGGRKCVEDGGLMSYGPDLSGMFRRAADFVDKLPHGEKPGDMPVQNWKLFETGFMVFGFALQVLIVASAIGIFWYWQNKATSECRPELLQAGQAALF